MLSPLGRAVVRTLVASLLLFHSVQAEARTARIGRSIANRVRARFEARDLFRQFGTRSGRYFEEKDWVFVARPRMARVMTLIGADALIGFLRDGELKNQHDTGTSGNTYDPSVRLVLESEMAGIDFRRTYRDVATRNRILPKYMMVEFWDFARSRWVQENWDHNFVRNTEEIDSYGEIALYFDDDVRSRTTFTPLDSGYFVTPGSGAVSVELDDHVQSLSQDRILLSVDQMEKGEYFEGHSWGRIGLRNVTRATVPSDFFFDDTEVTTDQVKAALGIAGIPVYAEPTRLTDRQRRITDLRVRYRGRQISPGRDRRTRLTETTLDRLGIPYF